MTTKELGNHNLKIHYIGTFFFSVAFLAPIMTLFYKFHGFSIDEILFLSSIYLLLAFLLEIPTSAIGDNYSRSKVLKYAVFFEVFALVIYAFFPSKELIYLSLIFVALTQALWNGTAQAKLQDDLKACDREKDFGKVIGKLVALVQVGALATPIIIYFVLKHYGDNGYYYLALLDLFMWFVIMFFIMQFRDYEEVKSEKGKVKKGKITHPGIPSLNSNRGKQQKKEFKSYKEHLVENIDTIKRAMKFLKGNKKLIYLLVAMIFGSNLYFIAKVILPHITDTGVENYLSSYIVWLSTFAGVIASYNAGNIANKLGRKRTFKILILFNFILHILAGLFFDNNIVLVSIFIAITFVQMLYIPVRNHILAEYTDIKEKATIRSIFVSVILAYTAFMLFILSFVDLKISIFIISFLIFVGFLFSLRISIT